MRRRILIVDDEPGMLRAVRRVLEQSYDVLCASSPDEALAGFEEFHPDLAILDIRMPGMDGFELIGRLKGERPDLDVILMTGSVGESDRKLVRAIREKAFYFIQKPFDREVLQTLVERCLELRTLAERSRSHTRWLEGVLGEARAFQDSLLPDPEARIGAIRVGAGYLSCDDLGGDFYDYASCGREAVAFLIADVSGHGTSAAMLTGVVKSAFQSCSGERYEPAAVVERVFAGIRTFSANRFVTLFCGRLDAEERSLDYVNAGHPPAIVWEADAAGSRELLGPTGPLVSPVLEAACWRQQRRSFNAGQRILLYTDGVTEAPGSSGFYDLERLQEAITRAPAGGAQLVDAVVGDVRRHMQGRRAEDDMTLLTVGLS